MTAHAGCAFACNRTACGWGCNSHWLSPAPVAITTIKVLAVLSRFTIETSLHRLRRKKTHVIGAGFIARAHPRQPMADRIARFGDCPICADAQGPRCLCRAITTRATFAATRASAQGGALLPVLAQGSSVN